jgi:hypothetical protein
MRGIKTVEKTKYEGMEWNPLIILFPGAKFQR